MLRELLLMKSDETSQHGIGLGMEQSKVETNIQFFHSLGKETSKTVGGTAPPAEH